MESRADLCRLWTAWRGVRWCRLWRSQGSPVPGAPGPVGMALLRSATAVLSGTSADSLFLEKPSFQEATHCAAFYLVCLPIKKGLGHVSREVCGRRPAQGLWDTELTVGFTSLGSPFHFDLSGFHSAHGKVSVVGPGGRPPQSLSCLEMRWGLG